MPPAKTGAKDERRKAKSSGVGPEKPRQPLLNTKKPKPQHTKRRRESADFDSESDEDCSGEYGARPSNSSSSILLSNPPLIHPNGTRDLLPPRALDSPLNLYSDPREMVGRLAAFRTTSEFSVYPKPVYYSDSTDAEDFADIYDNKYTSIEADAIAFIGAATSRIITVLMNSETGPRTEHPSIKLPYRHAWLLVVEKEELEVISLAVWDPDMEQRVEDKKGEPLKLEDLEEPCQRMLQALVGNSEKNMKGIWSGGYGNRNRLECLELSRLALKRVVQGVAASLGLGMDLIGERMISLEWVQDC